MKVYHIDTKQGDYDTVTEQELKGMNQYWRDDEIREIECSEWQLKEARLFIKNEEWRDGWEEEFGCQPSVIDLVTYWNKK